MIVHVINCMQSISYSKVSRYVLRFVLSQPVKVAEGGWGWKSHVKRPVHQSPHHWPLGL